MRHLGRQEHAVRRPRLHLRLHLRPPLRRPRDRAGGAPFLRGGPSAARPFLRLLAARTRGTSPSSGIADPALVGKSVPRLMPSLPGHRAARARRKRSTGGAPRARAGSRSRRRREPDGFAFPLISALLCSRLHAFYRKRGVESLRTSPTGILMTTAPIAGRTRGPRPRGSNRGCALGMCARAQLPTPVRAGRPQDVVDGIRKVKGPWPAMPH